ncbi:elongation factor Ts [Thermosulfidibacter takaii ABI70S6]|uniref:Elongation factor Ts n=1 Tax=Thermosulfidibacter takaii (strain DSM 17441 / JCM 13301 / NBRC 103674 / ABI70S6) TaxID=1298851 RepID=A0A0S3QVT1_THET7|nr:translation elongation factor Ts [Thermosulfidibacter takaii]BAT72423.1 elongation factor Ts [Thermosulfidibacter takaii ABI70S6]
MAITAQMVKELRERTGAGMMECKKALEEANGDMEKAIEILKKKGVAKAEKKASRETKEGLIGSYIHMGGKIGVLVEVNCETDFVARTDEFQNLVKDIAMQIAAMNPKYVSIEDVPQEVIEKEKAIYREQALASGKPEHVVDRIVEGKLQKFFEEVCLLEQRFIKDDSKKVKDVITEVIAKLGENIKVSKFVRFQIGVES